MTIEERQRRQLEQWYREDAWNRFKDGVKSVVATALLIVVVLSAIDFFWTMGRIDGLW